MDLVASALRVYFDFQEGDGWEEVTPIVSDQLTIVHRACSDNWHYAINVANLVLRYDAATFVAIKNASLSGTKILVLITKTENEVETNFFSGFFAPSVNLVYNGIDYLQEIRIEAEDFTTYLDVDVGQYTPAYENFQVMNASASGISIVHRLFALAGLDHSMIDPSVTISGTVEAFTCSDSAKALPLLDTLLFENGYVVNWNEQGLFSPIRWLPVSGAVASFEFNDTNICLEVEEAGGFVDVDGVKIGWFDVATVSGVRLFTADLPFADDGSFAGYIVFPGFYYPNEVNPRWWEPAGAEPRTVYQEYNMDGVKARTSTYWDQLMRVKAWFDSNGGSGSGLTVLKKSTAHHSGMHYGDVSAVINDMLATADFSDVLITKNHTISDQRDANIERVITEFYNKKAQIRYQNTGPDGPPYTDAIYYMHIDGDAVYRSAQNEYIAGVATNSEKIVDYPSQFIFNEVQAIEIAQALLADAKLGGRAWTFQSEARVAEGTLVDIDLLNGTIGTGIVLERTYNDYTQMFSYIVKATSYYVFVNESRAASIYPATPNTEMVRLEAQGSSAIGAAREASIILDLSTSAIERSRVGLLTPPTIEMSSIYGYNNEQYAGRYRVEVAVSGTDYITQYESAADEYSYEYTVPVTISGLYVQRVRVGLYRAGAFDTLLKSAIVSVTAEAAPAPLYWGALLTAPSEDYNENDYYFDNNAPISGGGYLRYWTGSLWDQATGTWPYWGEANSIAMNDMVAWTNVYGTDIAAVNAMIVNLTSQYAFIQNLFAQQIEVPTGGRIRYYNGAGVQKRCVEMAEDHVDWIDTPDTTPASDEVLRGRIGRLGVGETILVDGDFRAPISGIGAAETELGVTIGYTIAQTELASGEKRIAYRRTSDGHVVERRDTGTGWGAEIDVSDASAYFPAYCPMSDGSVYIGYRLNGSKYIVERLDSGSGYGDEAPVVEADSAYPAYLQTTDGARRIAYRGTATGYLYEKTNDGTGWSEAAPLVSASALFPSYIRRQNGEVRVCYTQGVQIRGKTLVEGAWGSSYTIYDATGAIDPAFFETVQGQLGAGFMRVSDYLAVYSMYDDATDTWGDVVVLSLEAGTSLSFGQSSDGNLNYYYVRNSDGELIEGVVQRYARLGAGIIEAGYKPSYYADFRKSSSGVEEEEGVLTTGIVTSNNANQYADNVYIFYRKKGNYVQWEGRLRWCSVTAATLQGLMLFTFPAHLAPINQSGLAQFSGVGYVFRDGIPEQGGNIVLNTSTMRMETVGNRDSVQGGLNYVLWGSHKIG